MNQLPNNYFSDIIQNTAYTTLPFVFILIIVPSDK